MTKEDSSRPGYDEAVDQLVEALDHATVEQERIAEIRREVLGLKQGDTPEQRNRLLAMLDRFETDHPKLTSVMNDVAYYLSGSGI